MPATPLAGWQAFFCLNVRQEFRASTPLPWKLGVEPMIQQELRSLGAQEAQGLRRRGENWLLANKKCQELEVEGQCSEPRLHCAGDPGA